MDIQVTRKSISQYIYRCLPYILIGFVFVFNLSLYFTHQLMPFNKFFDSDGIYLPTLYNDIIVNGGSYSDWYGSAAPYYFPDMFLYAISNFICSDFYYAIPLYFTLISAIILFTLFKIYRHFFNYRDALYLSAITSSVVYIIPFDTYIFQFISVFHFGEFVVELISVYLVFEILKDPQRKRYPILLFVLSILTIASDNMYILHFILPSLATTLILWFVKVLTHKQSLYILGLLITATVFGKLLGRLITLNYSEYANITTLSFDHFLINIKSVADIFMHSFTEHIFITTLMLLVYIVIIISFIFYKHVKILKVNELEKGRIFYISLYLLFMLLGNLLAVSLLYPHTVYIHYMLPIFLMPIYMFPTLFKQVGLNLEQKMLTRIYIVLTCALFSILSIQSYKQFNKASIKTEYYPSLVSCVDDFVEKTGAKDGIGGYWESKSITMLSKKNINIVQFNYDLTPYKAVTSMAWYRDSYDFALIKNNAINKKKLLHLNGKPTKIYKCEDGEILYYKYKLIPTKKTL